MSALVQQMIGARPADRRRTDDFHETPRVAVEALLNVETFTGPIWEPACGLGAISEVLIEHGHDVISTDLVDRGYGTGRTDFLLEWQPRAPNVVTNPPYKLALAFAQHALALTNDKVALLLRLAWLESATRAAVLCFASAGTCVGLRLTPADDAPPRVDRSEGVLRNSARVVRVEQGPQRRTDRRVAAMSAVPPVIVEDWKPVGRNTLLGFCRVRLPSRMILHDVAVHMKNGRLWASPSSKPRLTSEGQQMRGPDGKTLWTPIVSFETKALSDRFSAQVIEALGRAFPNALPDPATAELAP